jgi:uncharacterized protein DUF2188
VGNPELKRHQPSGERQQSLEPTRDPQEIFVSKKAVHTVPNSAGKGWVNKVGGEVVSRHRTQDNAANKGRAIARQNQSEHAIHRSDGTIGRKNSYGPDPNPPRDKNR